MRHGLSILEVLVAVFMLALLLGSITFAMKSGVDTATALSESTERINDEQRLLDAFKEHIRSADPGSFVLADMGTGCSFSFVAASPQAEYDFSGNLVYDVGYICEYNSAEQTLSIESYHVDAIGTPYQPSFTLGGVDEFGVYYHKKYRALQMSFEGHLTTISVRSMHKPNGDGGRLHYDRPPFLPMELSWSNLGKDLPLVVDIRLREQEGDSQVLSEGTDE